MLSLFSHLILGAGIISLFSDAPLVFLFPVDLRGGIYDIKLFFQMSEGVSNPDCTVHISATSSKKRSINYIKKLLEDVGSFWQAFKIFTIVW